MTCKQRNLNEGGGIEKYKKTGKNKTVKQDIPEKSPYEKKAIKPVDLTLFRSRKLSENLSRHAAAECLEKILHHQNEITIINRLLRKPNNNQLAKQIAGPYYGNMNRKQLHDQIDHRIEIIREAAIKLINLYLK